MNEPRAPPRNDPDMDLGARRILDPTHRPLEPPTEDGQARATESIRTQTEGKPHRIHRVARTFERRLDGAHYDK
jgi:hypothetical protein